jgi:SMC interacting uncharacterized protein involved in chromosome segregation
MTKDELIAKQQLQIEEYKKMLKENTELKRDLEMMFYAIGQPLNDNILQFNKEQQKWCFRVVSLVEQLNAL